MRGTRQPGHYVLRQYARGCMMGYRGGVVVIDKKGNLCQLLNKSSGLRDESIYYAYSDREGTLWLAMDNGIARVETPAPFSQCFQEVFGYSPSEYKKRCSPVNHNSTKYPLFKLVA